MIQLKGHTQGIRGIVFPTGSDTIYSASRNGIVHIWDYYNGQLLHTINLAQKIGCFIGQGPWIFAGLNNSIKAWNVLTKKEYTLGVANEWSGFVYSMATSDHLLCSGAQDGSVLVWMGSSDNLNPFKVAASLKGHAAPVTCLNLGSNSLCSGSTDGSIRVWDLKTFKCLHTITKAHNDVVMSLICWNDYLLSCSLDKKIKVWASTENGDVQVVYTHDVKHGVICLFMMYDQQNNPVLLCSRDDGCVCLFDFPSFHERGRVYSKDEVRRIETRDGLVFIGDEIGTLAAWDFAKSNGTILQL